MRERLNRWRARWPWFDTVMSVQDRYTELQGSEIAAAVTLSVFISLFPALLVGTAVIGFIAAGQVDLSGEIVNRLGLTGTAAQTLRDAVDASKTRRQAASVIGLVGLVWSALGVVDAIRLAVDRAWQVKGGGILDKGKALVWLIVTGALVVATAMLVGLAVSVLPAWLAPITILVSAAINVLMFWFTFALIGSQKTGWRPLLPGAMFAGIGLQVLTLAGAIIVPHSVASSSALYGSLGVVFAILAWLYFFGRLMVYASTLNVVLYERRRGTVTVEVEAPRFPGEVPVGATRGGVVVQSVAAGANR